MYPSCMCCNLYLESISYFNTLVFNFTNISRETTIQTKEYKYLQIFHIEFWSIMNINFYLVIVTAPIATILTLVCAIGLHIYDFTQPSISIKIFAYARSILYLLILHGLFYLAGEIFMKSKEYPKLYLTKHFQLTKWEIFCYKSFKPVILAKVCDLLIAFKSV